MFLSSANIKNRKDMPRDHVRSDAHDASRLGSPVRTRAVFYQEIGEGKERRDEEDVRWAQPKGWQLAGPTPKKTTPIGLSPQFKILDQGWKRLSRDPGDELPGQSDRGVTWAVVKLNTRESLPPFVLASTHFINGGWSDKNKKELRREIWHEAEGNLTKLIKQWNENDLSVFMGGDMNRPEWKPNFTRDTVPLHQAHIDYIWACPAARGVRVGEVGPRITRRGDENYTDHPFIAVNVKLLNPKKR